MLGRSLTLFEVFGVKVKVNLGWALIAVFIAWSLAQGVFPSLYEGLAPSAYRWMAVAAILGLAASIVLHELAHSLVARAFGIPLSGITLFALGGVAEIEKEPSSPAAEFLMAVAGPAVSLLIAAALGGLNAALGEPQARPALSGVLDYLRLLNIVLAVFNMIPAFPLDGGRALRAIVWAVKRDYRAATRFAAGLGSAFGVALMIGGAMLALAGAFTGGLWWILIGLFLRGAAEGADFQEEASSQLKGRPVRDVMTADPDVVSPETPLDRFVEEQLFPLHHDLFPVVRDGRAVGVIGLREIKRVPRGDWSSVSVGEAATPLTDDLAIDASADAFDSVARMQRSGHSRLLVLDQGRLVGMLSLKDLLELIAIRLELGRA